MTQLPVVSVGDVEIVGRLTWRLLVARHLARYGARTREGYAVGLRRWVAWCQHHGVQPDQVDRAVIELWARTLDEHDGLGARTRAGYIGAVCGMFRTAHIDGLIARDPGVYVERPRTPRVSSSLAPTRSEVVTMLGLAADDPNPTVAALVHLLALNGLRLGETLAINVEDIAQIGDWRIVHLHRRKGGDPDNISVHPIVAEQIDRARDGRSAGPLLLGGTGNRLRPRAARKHLYRLHAHVGITRRITPHSYRHGFVTLSLDAGARTREIMAATGHTDPSMIAYYDRSRSGVEHNATHVLTPWLLDQTNTTERAT